MGFDKILENYVRVRCVFKFKNYCSGPFLDGKIKYDIMKILVHILLPH